MATAIINLSSLNGSNGFRVDGTAAGDFLGGSVSNAGDVNGDGFDDLVIGASGTDSTYVVFGKASGFDAAMDLVSLDGSDGFRVDGELSGIAIDNAGDINGDGLEDMLVRASGLDQNGNISGSSYVIFGKVSGFAATLDLSSLDGSNGFRVDEGATYDHSHTTIVNAGDVNGDGLGDMFVRVIGYDSNDNSSGSNYVVFGRASGFDATLDLSSLDGSNGFLLNGAVADGRSGYSIFSNGVDVNGDGLDDVIVGAPYADPNGENSGSSYVVFGKASGFDATLDLSTLDGSNGFRMDGVAEDYQSGSAVSNAGDINGDGFDDVIVGAPGANKFYYRDEFLLASGTRYVVFGRASGFDATLDLSSLDGSNGFRLDAGGFSYSSASSVGDINGDGFADMLVKNSIYQRYSGFYTAGYVVFGKASGFDAVTHISNLLDGSNGFHLGTGSSMAFSRAGDINDDGFDDLIASYTDRFGYSSTGYVLLGQASAFDATQALFNPDNNIVLRFDGAKESAISNAGDVNGDGFDDVIVGASGADPNGEGSGSSYVVFGSSNFDFEVIQGTSGNDDLVGTAAAEHFDAGDGNDKMTGGGGTDMLDGGSGDDVIRVPDLDFLSADGGAGNDLLELTGSGIDMNLDLFAAVSGIETIDLTGSGDNTLTLSAQDVLNLSDTTNTLVVKGNAGDRVARVDDGWADGSVQGNFHAFTKQGAILLIDAAVRTDPAPGAISLFGLNGNNGFRLDGAARYDHSGISVSNAGDVNGDGFADVIIGVSREESSNNDHSPSYVVFGKASGFDATMNLSGLNGNNGFRLVGPTSRFDGNKVSSAGDVNSDGFADVIIGAPAADPNGDGSGSSYVVFGKASGFSAALDLSNLNGNNGFRLDGAKYDVSGSSVSNAGDVNGDGFDDVIVGAPYADHNGGSSGSSYVVFGKVSGFDAAMNLSSLDGSDGFRLDGVAEGDTSGESVSSAGDVNGDGFDDVIISARGAYPNGVPRAGSSYVVFGKASGFDAAMNLSRLDGSNGFRLDGEAAFNNLGDSVSSAGDVNGDGFDDVIIGASLADPNGSSFAGSSYVVFGRASGFDAAMNLSSLDGSNGFRIDGAAEFDESGKSVSSAGDVNGDGFADVIISSENSGSPEDYPDSSYLIFGKASGFSATLNLSSIDGSNGIRLDGIVASIGLRGISVSGAEDVNGDGFDDLIVGTPDADPNGDSSGSSYVIFGRSDFGGGGEVIEGTPGNDKLTGTPLAERLEAGDGNDRMIGRGGADVFHGDAGDDYIQVLDLSFGLVDGGSGDDVLHTDGKDLNLDLANLGDKIQGIETICLFGRGDNELTLTAQDLLNLSDTDNTLRVNGNAGDRITVLDDGWVDEGNRGQGYFHVYTNDDAVLLVGMNVAIDFA